MTEPSESPPLSCYALHRALKSREGLLEKIQRVLRVTRNEDEDRYKYVYEKTGHGWVRRLVTRTPIPPADPSKLVEKLGQRDGWEGKWKIGGPSGLVGICQATGIREDPETVATFLAETEASLISSKSKK